MPRLTWISWPRVLILATAVLALVGIGIGISALSAPAERTGVPTIPLTPPPPRTQTPTPSSSAMPSSDPSASPSSSAGPATPSSSMAASGSFAWSTTTAPALSSVGERYPFVVAVETSAKLKPNGVATFIADTLNDPRSWTGDGKVRFSLVNDRKAATVIYLASTKTATRLCGDGAEAAYTCVKGGTVVINAERWKTPPSDFGATPFREFLVNHAVGHLLGKAHEQCPKSGMSAPVMQQQAAGLKGCTANPWPN